MPNLTSWGRQENRSPSVHREDERNPLLSLRREMDRLFEDAFRGFGLGFNMPRFGLSAVGQPNWPSIEVSDSETEVRVVAEVPGLSEKDVELTLEDGMLCIRGERQAATEDKGRGYSERFYGQFERRIALPSGVQEDKAEARFEHGVLTITVPKAPGTENRRRIPINAQAETKH